MLEAVAVVAGLDDMAMMRESVEQCRGHLGVTQDAGPFREAEVRRDHHRRTFIERAQQMEQQRPAGL